MREVLVRPYSRNSPEAAGRIIALALIADGQISLEEIEVLCRFEIAQEFGLPPEALSDLLQHLCEDLPDDENSPSMLANIDKRTMAALLTEVDDHALQRKLLHFVLVVVNTDRCLSEGESRLLAAMRLHWNLDAQPVLGCVTTGDGRSTS